MLAAPCLIHNQHQSHSYTLLILTNEVLCVWPATGAPGLINVLGKNGGYMPSSLGGRLIS